MRFLLRLTALLLALGLAAAGLAAWWLYRPLPLAGATVELSIEPGMPPRDVAAAWVQAGVRTDPRLLYAWFRVSGEARRIRAGSYQLEPGTTPRGLLDKMVRGEEVLETVRLLEGWTFRQFRAELARAKALRPVTAAMTDDQLMAAIGAPAGQAPEGRFFPDTYAYSRNVSDLTVLKRAYGHMHRQLVQVWAERAADTPLKTMDDALTLASIVEKETGAPSERGQVAGVFVNRLRRGMPLQTDPTVIYGLGDRFDGNLRKVHLLTDGPYNTYLRPGLPPTPISMPGLASLRAAVNPAPTRALYFVSRGDGTSEFNESIDGHNRAVDRFQRRRSSGAAR